MKTITEIAKILGSTIFVFFLVLFLTSMGEHFNCYALDTFLGDNSLTAFLAQVYILLKAIAIWVIGLIIYLFLRKRMVKMAIIYFSILTIIALYSPIYNALNRSPELDRELKETICAKSTDDGSMESTFSDLTYKEYSFVNSRDPWMPRIPVEANSINVYYMHDDFLGDFRLIIDFSAPPSFILDTIQYPHWTKRKGKYWFEDFAD